MRRACIVFACFGVTLGVLVAAPTSHARFDGTAELGANPTISCSALVGHDVEATEIGLPTNGAVVDTAALQAPADGLEEFCLVRGHVNGFDPAAPPINFQLNLPTQWNEGAVHFGGAGFNGFVVPATGNLHGTAAPRNAYPGAGWSPEGPERPLARGYVTFGSDSGNAIGTRPQGSFALNRESLENYSGDSIKRTRDAAMSLIETYYDRLPVDQYFAGGSKGGHEGLIAAQDYPDDYDGIIAYYPANQNQAMVISWDRMYQAWARPGGSLNGAETTLLQSAVMSACDGLDGATDKVIADVTGCNDTFDPAILRCDGGVDNGDDCLSQLQLETARVASTPTKFAFSLANGVSEMGAYPYLEGAPMSTSAVGAYGFYTPPVFGCFVQLDCAAPTANFDYRHHEARVKELSSLLDATDPDIDRFVARGGKLILVQGTLDTQVTHRTTSAYFDALRERYGKGLDGFARYYVQPGFAHGGGEFNLNWDSLSALENWTQDGKAPLAQIALDEDFLGARNRTMPLCDYPAWPRHIAGDPRSASSFACVRTDAMDATSTMLTVSTAKVNPGASVRLTAKVSGLDRGARGTVTFFDGDTRVAAAPLDGNSAVADLTLSSLGVHRLRAAFSPTAQAVADGSLSSGVKVVVSNSNARGGQR